jgi:hypothetical protein
MLLIYLLTLISLSNCDKSLLVDKNNYYFADVFSDTSNTIEELDFDISTYNITDYGLPILHSNLGTNNYIFLDFDGYNHTLRDKGWKEMHTRAYDPLDNDLNFYSPYFSYKERQHIINIWMRVSEDFAPFNVDVTTEEPDFSKYNKTISHCIITNNRDIYGKFMPFPSVQGVAYLNIFGMERNYNFNPAIVYWNNIGGSNKIAEVVSHEVGHHMGLRHDGYILSEYILPYYYGDSNNKIDSWGPIMGIGFNNRITQWSKGSYENANNFEDDLEILSNKLGYIIDDYSNTTQNAYNLIFVENNNVLETNIKGIISTTNDIDMFKFILQYESVVNINIEPFRSNINNGGHNLNVNYALYDYLSSLSYYIYEKPNLNSNVNTIMLLPKGEYYIGIFGIGHPYKKYPKYASLGNYNIKISYSLNKKEITTAKEPSSDNSGSTLITTTPFNRVLNGNNNILLNVLSRVNCSSYMLKYNFYLNSKKTVYQLFIKEEIIKKRGKKKIKILKKYTIKKRGIRRNITLNINNLQDNNKYLIHIKGIGSWSLTYFTDYLNQILSC